MVLVKLTKEVDSHKVGDIINYSKASAKDIIESGYGILIQENTEKETTKKINKKMETIEGISLILDSKYVIKRLCPTFGILKEKDDDHYYFGLNLPCKVIKKTEEGKQKIHQQNSLVFIKDNHTKMICDKKTLKDLNYILETELLQDKPRWQIEHIKKWLDDKEMDIIQPMLLFKKIKEQFEYYLDLPKKEWYDYLTLWVIGTYFYSFFNAYPMVYLHGLKNVGKTKVMTLCSYLSFNGSMYVGITAATLFRLIQSNKPSLFLDEIEKLLDKKREGSVDIEAMLNSGYKKGATVPRCEKGRNKFDVLEYDVYCPKMFAHVKGKVSRTLISRCIPLIMKRAKPKDKRSERWMEKHNSKWQELRNDLYVFGLENWKGALYYYEGTGEITKEIDIDNRDWELWKPILVLARLVDEGLYEEMNNFALSLITECRKEELERWEYIIVKVLQEKVDANRYYFVSEIREWLKDEFEREEDVPSSKSVGWELKRLGLTDRKKEGKKGTKWYLSRKIVDGLVLELNITNDINNTKNGVVSGVSSVCTQGGEQHKVEKDNNECGDVSDVSIVGKGKTILYYYNNNCSSFYSPPREQTLQTPQTPPPDYEELFDPIQHKCAVCGKNPCFFSYQNKYFCSKECIMQLKAQKVNL